MRITVLSDNIAERKSGLKGEWGLSLLIETEDNTVLLDTGASSLFKSNAKHLGIDLSKVDVGVLSHAHYDHSDGMEAFFNINNKAVFYLSSECKENCYGKRFIFSKYIGIKKGLMSKFSHRIKYINTDTQILHGFYLLPHKSENLSAIGKKTGLYIKNGRRLQPDDFCHEQSLVAETEKGLVVFNSCSHGTPENILSEVSAAFPGKSIYAFIGGLHLYRSKEEDIISCGEVLRDSTLKLIVTGHCTGDKPYNLLKGILGDRLDRLSVGKVIEI